VPPETEACDDFEPVDQRERIIHFIKAVGEDPERTPWQTAKDAVEHVTGFFVPGHPINQEGDTYNFTDTSMDLPVETVDRLGSSQKVAKEHDVCVGVEESSPDMFQRLKCAGGNHEPDLELEARLHQGSTYDHHDCVTYFGEGGKNVDEMRIVVKQRVCKHCSCFYGEPTDELVNRKTKEPEKER